LDASIKQYADPLYEKALFESASTVRRESVKYFQERTKTQDHRLLFSGVDYQAQVRIYAEHIERVTAARLDSYEKAFGEINRLPTEPELNEILNDFKATWELQIKQSNQALSGILVARNAPPGVDLTGDLRANSAHGHDRVLQEWKIWRGKVLLLQKAASGSEGRSLNGVSASANASQSGPPKSFAASSADDRIDGSAQNPVAFISYSWDSAAHKKWALDLACRLQSKGGVQIILDQWHLQPGHDRTRFMEESVTKSDFVILICTPDYARKANNREGGVGYEATIITGELADSIAQGKFIPILRDGDWKLSLPVWIKTKVGVDLRGNPYSDEQYQDLLRALHKEPVKPPPVGPKPVFGNSAPVDQEIVPPEWAVRAQLLDQDLSSYEREAIRRKLSVVRVHALHPRLTIWLTNRSEQDIRIKSVSLWQGNAGRDHKRLSYGVPSDNSRFINLGPHTENVPTAFVTDDDAMLKLQSLGIVDKHLPTFTFRHDVDVEVRVEYDLLGVDDEYRETVRVGVHGNRQIESM
jgi:hypothetical protein